MKRLLDLLTSTILLVMLLPLFLFVSLIVRIKLGSPIIFKQRRPGLHGKPFNIYKFRTMTDEKNSNGELLPDEIRLNGTGLFLRKYSLDEIPQLINVIKGDISLVGPRPLLFDYLPLYSKEQARRHEVRPGITGWAQINGRNEISWGEKFRLDVWYVDNQSFWLDLKILWLTVLKVVKSEGVNKGGHATTDFFNGSN